MPLGKKGILTLESRCSGRIGRTTLTAPYKGSTEVNDGFKPFLFKEADNSTGLFMHPMDHRLINHTNQIADLRREITALKEEKLKLKTFEWHHVTASLGISSTAIIIILVIFSVKYCKK